MESDGCFKSEASFTQSGEPINPGDYIIDVLMPVTSGQPRSVRNIIGDQGQNISGPLVKRFVMPGFHHLGKIAEYKVSFAVGVADARMDADARQSAANDEEKRRADLRLSSVLLATKTLKENLRNPASADWISVNSNIDGSIVCMKLRAQNGFGGMSIEQYSFLDYGTFSDRAAVWNRKCAGSGFYDFTSTVRWFR